MIPPELRKEMLGVLDECINSELKGVALTFGVSSLRLEAVNLLASEGAIWESSPEYFKITGSGYDYYENLKASERTWFKRIRLPRISLGLIAALAAVVAAVVAVLQLLTDLRIFPY